MMSILVKNAKDTADKDCTKCGSWIKHWENISLQKANFCANIFCHKTENIEGAHVTKVGDTSKKQYIVPLCHECNTQFGETLQVLDLLIPAEECK